MTTLTNRTTFVIQECCVCNVQFAMTQDMDKRRLADHKAFFCPSGHSQSYTGKTEAQKQKERADKLSNQVDAARARSEYWRNKQERTARSRSAIKGQLTKAKKRVAGGACPCCNRTFVDLAKHMNGQHPTYATDEATS